MLTIVSVALAAAAPMITKQIKHNNLSNAQTNLLGREIEKVRIQNNSERAELMDGLAEIEDAVADIDTRIQNLVPSGAVMYFDLESCPIGWTPLSNKYPNAENAFIRNQSGSGRRLGNYQQNAAPNITGTFGGINSTNNGPFTFQNSVGGVRTGGYMNCVATFNASLASPVYGRENAAEIRPDNIVLLACRKN